MKNRKLMATALSFLIMLSFTSCSKEKVMDKDGNMLEFTESEVIKKEGFFVHVTKSDDEAVYQPLLRPATVGFQSYNSEKIFDFSTDFSKYIMFADRDNLIPVITGSNFLVFVDTEDLLPATFKFEKMEDRGYTFGGLFETKDSENGLFIKNFTGANGGYYCIENSSFEAKWDSKNNIEKYSIDNIGGASVGNKNIDENGAFKGLEKDSNYKMATFIGTQYETVVVTADTHYFVAGEATSVAQKDCVVRTKNGYAVIKLPSNLDTGYYMINDEYMFFYDKNNSNTPTTDNFVLDMLQDENIEEVEPNMETTESSYYEVTFQDGDAEENHEDPGDVYYTEVEEINT